MLTPLRLKEFFAFPSSHPSAFGLKMMYTLGLALTLSPVAEKNAWLQKWRFRRFGSWYFIWFIMPLCIISLMQPYAFWSWLNFQVAELVELTRRVLRRFAVTPCDTSFSTRHKRHKLHRWHRVPDFCSGSVWCSAFIPGYLSSLLLYFSIHISGFRILQSHFPFCYSFWQSHLTYFHPFLSIDSKHGSFSLKRLPLSALRPLGREHVRWVALECKQSLLKPGSKGYRKRKKHATLVTYDSKSDDSS